MADDDLKVTSARAEITARDVSGVLVGVNTGVINKNFYGGNVYQRVQVYVLNSQGRSAGVAGLIEETPAPYKFLTPYTAADVRIFVGRDDEISQVNRIVHEQRLLVVHGRAGVGKTSLLAAGIIPKLIEEGLLVLQIQDYVNPVEVIYHAFQSNQEQMKVSLPERPTLPSLLRSVVDATEGTLVLVLDQFELLFEPSVSDQQRETFIASLVQSLREIPPNLLRLIVVIREEARARLWELDERLPDLLRCQFEVLPLNPQQAEKAIKEPLRVLKSRVTFYDDLVDKYLVPDLGEVSSESDAHFVHPPHLQIVCTSLYQKATEHDPPRVIDKKLYLDELKGADGIIAGYLKETLEKLEDEKRLAFGVMSLMATPGVERWVLPSQLQEKQPDVPLVELERILKLLVRAGLLVRRAGDGKFSFVSPTIAREMVRLAGPEAERRTQAGNELERIWLSWLARNVWATRGQLRYLETSGTHLTPRATQTLLLLRSAVERRETARIWLNLLRIQEGQTLIHELEGVTPATDSQPMSLSVLKKGAQLLGLPDELLAEPSDNGHLSFGPVAQNAAENRRSSVRQTCVLALSVISNDRAVVSARLDEALTAKTSGLKKKIRRAELRGALADADPEFASRNEKLPLSDRILIWRWRAARRIARDRRRWVRLMLGGAIGAGLALAFLRGLIAIFSATPTFPGIQFGSYFYYGFILGGSLSLGMALGRPLLLSERDGKATALLSILLGTIFFGVAHMLVTILNGLSVTELPLGILSGFVAGLAISSAVHVAAWNRAVGIGRLLLVLLAVGTFFGLLQLTFNSFREKLGDTIVIGWPSSFYASNFGDYVVKWWPASRVHYATWFDRVAILDLALAGTFLTAGLVLGVSRARKKR